MKILLVSEVFPPQTGGSGRWFWEIYRRLDRDAVMIAAGSQPGDEAFDQTHDLQVHRLPMSFPSWGIVGLDGVRCYGRLKKSLARLANDFRPTQIHCGKILPEGFAAVRLAQKMRLPLVCYVHGEELNIANNSRELRWMARRVFRNAERVIANSRNTAELLKDDWRLGDDQVAVLHPGVDVDYFVPADPDPAVRSKLGWGDRPVILTVGRLQKRKGHDQLIRALPEIRKHVPDVLYAIVGDGPEHDRLRQLAADQGVEELVDFRGEVGDEEIRSCYQQCTVFALPNRTVDGDFEGFGMVLIEAQACGKPVLAGDSGGTRETMVVAKTGELVDCSTASNLVEPLRLLLCDCSRRREMGVAARRWTENSFGWDSLADHADGLFESTGQDFRRGSKCSV